MSERTSLFLPTCLPAATGRLFATSLTRGALMPIVSPFSLASLPLSPTVVIAGGAVWASSEGMCDIHTTLCVECARGAADESALRSHPMI